MCADVRVDGKPHVCVLNEALMEVTPKEPFRWYPGLANAFLQSLISSGSYPFQFEFVMEEDPDWAEAHYWLDPLKQ